MNDENLIYFCLFQVLFLQQIFIIDHIWSITWNFWPVRERERERGMIFHKTEAFKLSTKKQQKFYFHCNLLGMGYKCVHISAQNAELDVHS